jgi:hypothetical protein
MVMGMNITVLGASLVAGIAALVFAAVTLVMALLRGYGWVVPARLVLVGLAYLTATIWTSKLIALAPTGVIDSHSSALVTAVAVFIAGGLLSPTYRQFRRFFFGENDRD